MMGTAVLVAAAVAAGAAALAAGTAGCAVTSGDGTAAPGEPERPGSELTAGLTAVGLPASPRWQLPGPGPETGPRPVVTTAARAGDTLVTVQAADAGRHLGGYTADGRARWSAGLPGDGPEPDLQDAGGAGLLVTTGRNLAALDPATGAVRWCSAVAADARVTVAPTDAGVLVAQQDGADSVLSMLDPATGDTRWSHDYEVHDGLVGPVVAGDTVSVFAVGPGGDGRRSGIRALRLGTGEPAWSSTVEFPRPFGAAAGVLLVRSDAGLLGVDPASGRTLWTTTALDPVLRVAARVEGPRRPGDPALLLQSAAAGDPRGPGGGVTAFDPATGAVRWELTGTQLGTDGDRWYTVRRADALGDRVLLQERDRLVVADLGTGRVLGRADTALAVVTDELGVAVGDRTTTLLTWNRP